jgi:hypothetical protein
MEQRGAPLGLVVLRGWLHSCALADSRCWSCCSTSSMTNGAPGYWEYRGPAGARGGWGWGGCTSWPQTQQSGQVDGFAPMGGEV